MKKEGSRTLGTFTRYGWQRFIGGGHRQNIYNDMKKFGKKKKRELNGISIWSWGMKLRNQK